MATTNFQDGRTPIIADWLNDVDAHAYDEAVTAHTSAHITYTQGGTGAVTTNVQTKLREFVSFADFGCVGDGSDEATKLQAALTYASANGKAIVDFSGNTYNYGTTLNVGAIEMYGNFTLNGTGSAYVNITGSLTEIGYISAAATAGTSTVTLSSVTGLAADDLLIFWNSVASSYSTHRTNYYDGEFARIDGVSGGNVTVQSNLLTSYSGVSTDKVFKSSGIRVVIDGPSFTGAGVFALRVQYADNVTIRAESVRTTGSDAALIINKCYNVLVEGGKFHAPYDGGGNYGISVSNSQHVTIRKVDSYGGRHAVTTGGDAENGAVPCRFVHIENSVLANDPDSGVYNADFHGNTIDSYYKDCVIFGRVGLAGENVSAINCDVHSWPNSNAVGPLCMHEVVGGRILFKDCRAFVGSGSTSTWVVGHVSSTLSANISKTYQVVVEGLDATLNSSITQIVNAFVNSSQSNAWVLDDFGVRGTLSGLTNLMVFTKSGSGVDASYINITNPRFDSSVYTLLSKSGTTLPSCRFLFPSFFGSDANGSWTKFPDGTMICRIDYSVASTAISTAFMGGFRSGGLTWTYPKAFISAPDVSITADDGSCFGGTISTAGTSSTLFFLTAIASQAAATLSAKLIAVGRWY